MPPDGRHVFFKGKVQMITYLHLYDIVRELYEDEEVTDVQSIYKDIGEYLINSEKLNNSKSFELGESNINIDLSKDAILVCAWNKERLNKIAARWPAKAVAQFYFY